MNRILIDNDIKELGKIKDNKTIINIKKDINLLINKSNINDYNFNIENGNINILCILENSNNINFDFNVDTANVTLNIIGYNNKNINIDVNLNKEQSNIIINNSVISLNKQDININVNHNANNTNSNVNNYGNTIDDGSIIFNVITKVNKGKKHCLVNQSSKIITSNDNNENRINPVLLIDEYEVNAKHSAFIGNFNSDELFYLESRGLSKKEASKLLLDGLLIGTLHVDDEEKEYLRDKYINDWR